MVPRRTVFEYAVYEAGNSAPVPQLHQLNLIDLVLGARVVRTRSAKWPSPDESMLLVFVMHVGRDRRIALMHRSCSREHSSQILTLLAHGSALRAYFVRRVLTAHG